MHFFILCFCIHCYCFFFFTNFCLHIILLFLMSILFLSFPPHQQTLSALITPLVWWPLKTYDTLLKLWTPKWTNWKMTSIKWSKIQLGMNCLPKSAKLFCFLWNETLPNLKRTVWISETKCCYYYTLIRLTQLSLSQQFSQYYPWLSSAGYRIR